MPDAGLLNVVLFAAGHKFSSFNRINASHVSARFSKASLSDFDDRQLIINGLYLP